MKDLFSNLIGSKYFNPKNKMNKIEV